MNALNQSITALNAALVALQGRLSTGVVVQQADLDAAIASINQVATTLDTLGT